MAIASPVNNNSADTLVQQQDLANQMKEFAKIQADQTKQQMQNVVNQNQLNINAEASSQMGKTKDKISY
ncbi:hypothetical protein J2W35_004179 [Variovorax boronicumulans]|uniref:hypothetical protein n=1 Tax=Variovorax boronicumulans TaxID=436515 RepID=UPI00277D8D45|nr:hypothetical protein [Variovorax boronicumulans]MDQ0083813.1 hypothetical protein [Variovorax boronicumulans]